MSINSAYQTSSNAIQQGLFDISQTAHRVAQSVHNDDVNLVEELVTLKQQSRAVEANMQVIKTLKDVDEHLIDIMA